MRNPCPDSYDIDADAELEARDRPTWRPSGVRAVVLPVDELLYRFAVGDREGAVAAAGVILDRSHVPLLLAAGSELADAMLDARARWLLPFIDGLTPLALVLDHCGLPRADALEAFCELLERGIVALR